MNKNMVKVAFAAAIVVASGVNVFKSQEPTTLSDVELANVEALATGEVVKGYTGPSELFDCPLWFTGDGITCKSENDHPCSVITCD